MAKISDQDQQPFDPAAAGTEPEAGYEEWLAEEIEAGCAELDAGEGIPAEQVWKKLGLG